MKRKIYAIITMVIGIAAIWGGCHTTSEIRAMSGWDSVEGKVLERRLEPGRKPWRREPKVVYEYAVGGKTFKNDQVYMLAQTDGDEADMQKLIDSEIPERPQVYYDAGDPKRSYLLPNSKLMFYILVPIGILLLLIGVVLLAGGKPNEEPVRRA